MACSRAAWMCFNCCLGKTSDAADRGFSHRPPMPPKILPRSPIMNSSEHSSTTPWRLLDGKRPRDLMRIEHVNGSQSPDFLQRFRV